MTTLIIKKICNKCKLEKLRKDFYSHRRTVDGMSYSCKDCQHKYEKAHYKKNKEKYLLKSKKSNSKQKKIIYALLAEIKSAPCADCKQYFKPWQMDFDHLDANEKHKDISQMVCCSIETVLKEVSKCEIVCANCHRDRTHNRLLQSQFKYGIRESRNSTTS